MLLFSNKKNHKYMLITEGIATISRAATLMASLDSISSLIIQEWKKPNRLKQTDSNKKRNLLNGKSPKGNKH